MTTTLDIIILKSWLLYFPPQSAIERGGGILSDKQ